MAVVTRKRQHGTTYYVAVKWDGKKHGERAGHDRAEARRLNARRLREIREGIYRPVEKVEHPTVRQYAETWIEKRTNRSAAADESNLRLHVLTRDWFAGLPVEHLENRHFKRLAEELKSAWSEHYQRPISPKMAANIYGALVTMCREAHTDGLLRFQPWLLPRGFLKRKSTKKRTPYSVDSVLALLRSTSVHPTARVFAGLAFLTGMREGEVCGRRWRDLDRGPMPLWCLTAATQYDDQPLKGDRHEAGEVARKVPVHPELAELLTWWWKIGFRLVHLRPPTPDDFIVPNEHGENLTRSAAYKMFRRAIAEAGVENLSLHASHNTFLTLARRGGARKEVIEKVTHNAAGDTVDQYTHWDWAPLCEAVLCLHLAQSQLAKPPALVRSGGDASGDVWSKRSQVIVEALGIEERAGLRIWRQREEFSRFATGV